MKTVPEITKEIKLVQNCEKISASAERSMQSKPKFRFWSFAN